jgi:Protein of unknown function (DUF3095)
VNMEGYGHLELLPKDRFARIALRAMLGSCPMDARATEGFFAQLPAFDHFDGVTDLANYRPLPEDWWLAASDVTNSTQAIEAGRYKAVNMAGASVISAILNTLGHRDVPFIFGGDGALVAIPETSLDITRPALAAVRAWVKDELDLTLRAALVPMRDVRANGHDVQVARFQAAPEVSYAMFAGGGASWAEAQMKAGRYMIEAAPSGTRPNLAGLSCRWNPIAARHGAMVSIIAVPVPGQTRAFGELVNRIVHSIGEQERDGHPVPEQGPSFSWPPKGLEMEARAAAPPSERAKRKIKILFEMALGMFSDKTGVALGRFSGRLYRSDTARNTDFRKFDDGLKMTLDIDAARLSKIEAALEAASRAGICHYGIHRQDSALMTCIVPSPLQRDHLHFVDGAAGGYAMAAAQMKAKRALS